jgi:hypothetical protein
MGPSPVSAALDEGSDKTPHVEDTVERTSELGVARLVRHHLDLQQVIRLQRPTIPILTVLHVPI